MSGALERLERAFAEGRLVAPHQGPNLVDLARSLALAAGASGVAEPDAGVRAEVGDAEHLVFVLVDGLGVSTLEAHCAPDGFLRTHQRRALRSVFPSATASALTTLATASWPGEHAVLGWWLRVPERDLDLVSLPFVRRADREPLEAVGVEAGDVFPLSAWLSRATRDAACLQPEAICESAYSRYSRGTVSGIGYPYDDVGAGVDLALERLRRFARPGAPASYTYLYTPLVDTASHVHGPASEEVGEVVREVEAQLERLAREGQALWGDQLRIVVSADHGLVEVPRAQRHVLEHEGELASLLEAPPSGEPRAPLFHVRPGSEAAFRRCFEARFGEQILLLEPDELAALYGARVPPLTRARLGTFVAIPLGPDVLIPRRGPKPEGLESVIGQHGGLLPAEMHVPLIRIGA